MPLPTKEQSDHGGEDEATAYRFLLHRRQRGRRWPSCDWGELEFDVIGVQTPFYRRRDVPEPHLPLVLFAIRVARRPTCLHISVFHLLGAIFTMTSNQCRLIGHMSGERDSLS